MLVILHTIVARTGLFCFYSGLTGIIIWYILKRKQYLIGISISILSMIILGMSLLWMPSIKNRIKNTREDLGQYSEHKDVNDYSMSKRFVALRTAYHIFLKNPTFGVAPADIGIEMEKQNIADKSGLRGENLRMEPHNQFMETLVTMGVSGLVLLLGFYICPLFLNAIDMRLIIFLIVFFAASQVESVLERQAGVTAFCFFYLLFFNASKKSKAITA
jgi:O-antigen ligase